MQDLHAGRKADSARLRPPPWRARASVMAGLGGVAMLAGVGAGASAAGAATTSTPTFTAEGAMAGARTGAGAVLLHDGQVLVAGGENPVGTPLRSVERYNPATNRWQGTGWLPVAVSQATTTELYNGDVLVAGGLTSANGSLTATASSALYNPNSGTWSAVGNLPFASYGGSAVLLRSGEVLYAGGFSGPGAGGNTLADAALFNPATGKWSATASMPAAVADATSALLPAGAAFFAGGLVKTAGASASVSGEAFRFVPSTDSWDKAAALPVPVADAASATLADGRVLLVGGETAAGGTPSAATQAYSPAANRWGRFADAPYAASNATATRLGSGAVLFAGGSTTSAGAPSNAAAIFTPSRGQWSSIAAQPVARTAADAVALSSGGVLIFGGTSSGGPTNATELFHYVSQPTTASPKITSAASVHGQVGAALSFTVTTTGSPTATLSESGALPSGLAFHAASNGTATISGTPTVNGQGSTTVTLKATNSVGSATQSLQLVIAPPPLPTGYWYPTSSGDVLFKGTARPIAPHSPQHPRQIVAMAATPQGTGYYLVSSYGGVFCYGNATFQGSITSLHLRTPTVAFGVAPNGHGYYIVTRAGNVFNRGGAPFFGSMAGKPHPPIVAFAVAPNGRGYWLVSRSGSVYSFGSARYLGSKAGQRIAPIVAFGVTADGNGYWLVSRSGNVYPFGDARFLGSLARRRVPPVTAFAVSTDGRGYWLVTRAGNVFNFGDARYYGSSAGEHLPGAVVAFVPER